jgi:DmsE family decaheme c-type cytochrome
MIGLKHTKIWHVGFIFLVCLPALVQATESNQPEESLVDGFIIDTHSTLDLKKAAEYSKDGADTCLQCHDEDSDFPVMTIFKTAHGNQNSQHGPFAKGELQCESCHGPAGEHSKKRLRKGEVREKMIAFNRSDALPVEEKNAICLSCHQQSDLGHWSGSMHQISDTVCSDCHTIHSVKDPMSDKAMQIQQCGQCHTSTKLALQSAFSHPLREGQMGCNDCHRPHDSDNEKLLLGETINETCYQCHAEKRGPFLWEHEPVSDNCTNCHSAHGSNQPDMLTQRAPYLCQSCHSSEGHVSFAFDSNASLAGNPSAFLLGKSCTNCHSQVHGSNHPSGAKLQR